MVSAPGGSLVDESKFSHRRKEHSMSLTLAIVLNALVATAVVAALAYASRIPYRLDRLERPEERWAERDEIESVAYERAAA
jgi:hypothetical protein